MSYFARISSELKPANMLQTYLLGQVKQYDRTIVDNPNALLAVIEAHAVNACVMYRRCTPQKAQASKDHRTGAIRSISANGLFTLSLEKIAGQFFDDENPNKQIRPFEIAKVEQEPKPDPNTDTTLTERQVKVAVFTDREKTKVHEYKPYTFFPFPIRDKLLEGRIWGFYLNVVGQIVAEEYGGKTHVVNA